MKLNWKNILIQTVQTLGLIFIISVAVDYWRKPNAPMNAATAPFVTLKQSQPQTLAQLSQNQTVVLYFWGSWCGICQYTSPVINDLEKWCTCFGGGFAFRQPERCAKLYAAKSTPI